MGQDSKTLLNIDHKVDGLIAVYRRAIDQFYRRSNYVKIDHQFVVKDRASQDWIKD